MKQTSLATCGFNKYAQTTAKAVFLHEMDASFHWPISANSSSLIIPELEMVVPTLDSRECLGFTACNNGLTLQTLCQGGAL